MGRLPIEWLAGDQLLAFNYHSVGETPSPHVKHLYPVTTPDQFRSHIGFFVENFNLLSYSELLQHKLDGVPLPRRSAFLSFDDGFDLTPSNESS